MDDTETKSAEDEPTALLIVPGSGGKSERVLTKFLQMTLEYRYGLEVELITNVRHVVKALKEQKALHSVYLIQGQPVSVNSTIPILTAKGTLPLFILLPLRIATEQRQQCEGVEGVYVCDWESAFGHDDTCLAQTISRGLTQSQVGSASLGENPEERMRQRLEKLDTLPSLPTVLGRLMKLIGDPESTMSDLEVLLNSEPSIALKLTQVANSAANAGASGQGVASLKDAITRLGMKKVGAIAQQIALINSMVRPETSEFDLRRFWGHSLACAIVADKVHGSEFVTLEEKIPFNDYWIAALLHDCGKAVQGFFFYDWFERIVETMEDNEITFYEAENELGGMVTHDQISEMMMQKAEMTKELVEAVALHHTPGESPSPLVALVHVANNLCSEMGFGYNDAEIKYDRAALKVLGLKRQAVRDMAEALQEPVAKEVMDVVSQCLGD
ncbi:MAG: HDOD domain-containing protein [Gemmatimonadetes bacterium]|nr:HDOD domain-containing protein [Gemmatimonadota bacterium]